MPEPKLAPSDHQLLAGSQGEAAALAMRVTIQMARVMGAPRLLDVRSAHIDGCLYHGEAGLDFAERLASGGARVRVPTTLNVGSLDLLHPELYRGDEATRRMGRRLMDLYVSMGCQPSWTCAPYHLPGRPGLGDQIAWAESNAIVFANSVLGARTNRYGDFIDICAAITGRVPDAGLHRSENRRGQALFRLRGIPGRLLAEDVFYPVLGHLIGMRARNLVPVVEGVPESVSEDQLRALGAAAASSGGVALFHVVGVTPESPTLGAAFAGSDPRLTIEVTPSSVARARDSLTTSRRPDVSAVSLGTPHFSIEEFARLTPLLAGVRVHEGVEFYVSTSRHVLAEIESRGWVPVYERAGVRLVVDTCTYITPILRKRRGVVMTNSGKWAYYAPGTIGVDVAFGSTEECVRSGAEGRVWRDQELWAGI